MRVNENKVNKEKGKKKADDNIEYGKDKFWVYEQNNEEPIHFWLCRKNQSRQNDNEHADQQENKLNDSQSDEDRVEPHAAYNEDDDNVVDKINKKDG